MSRSSSWPILTILGVIMPIVSAVAANALVKGSANSGGWGLGEIFIFVVLCAAGAVLGAVCIVFAMVRKEPLRPLQIIVLLANVYVAWFFGRGFFRGRIDPARPNGTASYLLLAPVTERFRPEKIVLAYPTPPTFDRYRRGFVGLTDSAGVIVSVRDEEFFQPVKPGEVRIYLDSDQGRLTVARQADFLWRVSERDWKRAAYVEVRKNFMDIGVPVGVVDQNRRPVNWRR